MIQLSEAEIRVLGVLIEKSLTQSGSHPMTINAILVGANQLQNRDPVVEYSEAQVSTALGELIRKKLAVQAPPEPSARANRFGHRVVEEFHWDRREQAVMAELLLRGRQTAGELRSRASRMSLFADIGAVVTTLEELQHRGPKFVEELPREPGRSTTRFRHLLSNEATPESSQTAEFHESAGSPLVSPGAEPMNATGAPLQRTSNIDLESRVEEIERRLDAIERDMHTIRELTR